MKNRFYYIIWGAIAFILYIEMYVSVRFQLEYGAQMVPKAIALMSPFVLVQGLLFFALYALTVKEEVKKRKSFLFLGFFFSLGSILSLFIYVTMLNV